MKRQLFILGIVCLALGGFGCKDSPTTPDPYVPPIVPQPAPTIIAFTADPGIVAKGDSSMLDWETKDATSVFIDNGVGSVSPSMIEFVYPEVTTTYTLTATNSKGSVTASVQVEVRGADLRVAGAIKKKMKSYGSPYFEGVVKNIGDNTAWNASITIYCYGDAGQTLLIDTAWDYLADGNDIRPGDKVVFEAICFDLDSHSQIKSRRIEFDWLEGDIEVQSEAAIQGMYENQRRAQELKMKEIKAEMEKGVIIH